jgi:hypothetical protein
MDNFVKYKRITETFPIGYAQEDIQKFLDSLVINDWKVINYNESIIRGALTISVFCGKERIIL